MFLGLNLKLFTMRPGLQHAELIGQLREIGYEWIELPIYDPSREAWKELGALFWEQDVKVSISSTLPADCSLVTDEIAAQRAIDYHARLLETALVLGATIIAGPLYHPVGYFPDDSQPTLQQRLAERLPGLEKVYGHSGVVFALEPLNRYETKVVNCCPDAARAVGGISGEWLGIVPNTFHMHIEERSPLSALAGLGSRLVHIHAAENDHGSVGYGQVRWEELADALQRTGYNGALVVEAFGQSLRETAATHIWRDVGGDPMKLAAASHRFLRRLLGRLKD
jgi:D-psicose/D-tagatose/L-ribulose 3-epimerase